MHMDRVQITMKHTEESIKRLAKVQYDTFSVHTKVIWYGICLICILMGFGLIVDIGTPWRYIPLAFGCVAFANIGASSKARASNTLDAVRRQGGFPCTTMTFLNNKIRISEKTGGSADLEYNSLFRLVEDQEYLYLFTTRTAAYMVPKEQVHDMEGFKAFLEKKSGQAFHQPVNLLKCNLSALRSMRKK